MPKYGFLFKKKHILSLLLLLFALFEKSVPVETTSMWHEFSAALRDQHIQWFVFVTLAAYVTAFQIRSDSAKCFFRNSSHYAIYLNLTLGIACCQYMLNYSSAAQSLQAISLFSGITFAKAIALWNVPQDSQNVADFRNPLLGILIVLLASAVFWQAGLTRTYRYHNALRWSGPWDNPNIFGLIMGTGLVLAVGLYFQTRISNSGFFPHPIGPGASFGKIVLIFYLAAAGLMGIGLLHSFSRGAWLGTFFGLAYLGAETIRYRAGKISEPGSRFTRSSLKSVSIFPLLKSNRGFIFVILTAIAIVSFWCLRDSDCLFVRRALGIVNQSDFSLRNRLAAWEGALQMMAEKPWHGFGWNQPEQVFRYYYLPPQGGESAAIQTNDFLLLGASLGIPAFLCFAAYIWQSMTSNSETTKRPLFHNTGQNTNLQSRDFHSIICRAGATGLLVGFWFDGGLLELTTASVFWILLEQL